MLLPWRVLGSDPALITTDGPVDASAAGRILPHEHIFTDLRGPEVEGHGQADLAEVIRVMKPLLLEAREAGVGTIVECTSVGVGRNVPVISRLAKETGLRIVVPTGVYGRAHYAPKKFAAMSEDDLARWMMTELVVGIENTGVRAGFIKIASSETELRPLEAKFLRAAGRASRQTGAAIASHTTSGEVARQQARILRELDAPLDRFIWVHAQAETNLLIHAELARQGVYIELDSVGASDAEDQKILRCARWLAAAGLADKILLSQDAGWYHPGQPAGGRQRPYTALLHSFTPKLKNAGFDDGQIEKFTRANPFRAFAIAPAARVR